MTRNTATDVYTRINRLSKAWRLLRPQKTFVGYTCDSFDAAVAASIDARKEVDERYAALREAMARRDDADVRSRKVVQRVVSAVKADADEGEDGELYVAMGYVPRAVRNTRRSVRPTKPAATAAARPAAKPAAQPAEAMVET